MEELPEITFKIHCHDLPGAQFEQRRHVRLGVQKGDVVEQDVAADVATATFTVTVGVARNLTTQRVRFTGPFVKGPPEERFIYLSWGERDGENWDMFRRAKIHLSHLTWQRVDKALRGGEPIEARLGMTDAKGGPRCASVRDDIEWY